ncbi:hypothetical protein [Streptomyces sp. Amel2xC10]|uniref:DUF7144 family membrane protein n=1 Tax=Streptomyces sp. Amel2xC10 TaxID=1305826 RepID=UPI000A083ED0|nr:hypothetical protein [Streptomyces sp. Amel2xC10]SMF72028.1 hypothetical protein SAMN02745830_05596 [Streptomyces sp. Amel2xC10]
MSGQSQSPSSQGPPIWDPSHQGTDLSGPAPHWAGRGGAAHRGVVLAGVLMLVSGLLHILQGIAAIAEDDVYAVLLSYAYEMNLTAWGWILLCVGVVMAATGAWLFREAEWARHSGVALASLSVIVQFLFLPYAPVWSVILIALDVIVIWALVAYRPDLPGR